MVKPSIFRRPNEMINVELMIFWGMNMVVHLSGSRSEIGYPKTPMGFRMLGSLDLFFMAALWSLTAESSTLQLTTSKMAHWKRWFACWKRWFSIAMLNYQRVPSGKLTCWPWQKTGLEDEFPLNVLAIFRVSGIICRKNKDEIMSYLVIPSPSPFVTSGNIATVTLW
jgi:hypothetical protein